MLPLSTILDKINPLEKEAASGPVEFYLGLVISDKKVQSTIWTLSATGEKDLTFGSLENWNHNSAEDLIVAADASIATAVTKLSALSGQQPGKVILGLPESWVEENNIKKAKQTILQAVCQKLSLKPLGFVVTPEAIAHYLKQKEGGLPSAIVINLQETEVVVSLIVQGKFLGSKVVGRSDNLALDLEEGLLRFNHQGVLPNRILLVKDAEIGNIEELKQTLVAYPWVDPDGDKKLNFLQLPRIEVAEEEMELTAVVNAGCRELGWEEGKTAEVVAEKAPALAVETPVTKEETALPSELSEPEPEDWPEEDFGFVKEGDILAVNPPQEEKPNLAVSPASDFSRPKIETVTEEEANADLPTTGKKVDFLGGFNNKISGVFKFLKPGKMFFALPQLSFGFLPRKGLSFALGGLFFLVLAVFFGFWQFTQAEVKIFIQPQKIDKEVEFTVSDEAETVDREKMIVPAREKNLRVLGEKTSNVTGKKTVGDKASGEVVVYNRTEEIVTLAQGEVLKGPGGLRFVLKQEVKVASKTADLVNGVDKWGEAKVGVEAEEIGAQYNLAANSVLTFEDFPSTSLLVKNPEAFSGGTSREIQAVSKDDRAGLQQTLLAELKNEAEGKVAGQIFPGDQVLVNSLSLEDKTDHFDHQVGDEASSLNLKTEANFSFSYVKKEDFEALTEKIIAELVPEGYVRNQEAQENRFTLKDEKKGIYLAQIKEEFWPEINLDEVPLSLKGKTSGQAETWLKSLGPVAGLEIKIKPKVFSYFRFLPLKAENINVAIETF